MENCSTSFRSGRRTRQFAKRYWSTIRQSSTDLPEPSLRGAKRRSNPWRCERIEGLLRGACHRARIRATRWLAMTAVTAKDSSRRHRERIAVEIAQPVRRLAQAAEREQVKSGDRRGCGRRRRAEAAHDVIGSGIGQQPAEPPDLAAQGPHRIADAAAQAEFGQ